MFKRILLTAVLGAGLVLTVPFAAEADHKGGRDRDRRDWGIRLSGSWGRYPVAFGSSYPFGNGGHDRQQDLFWYPTGYGAGAPYGHGAGAPYGHGAGAPYGLGGYYPGGAVLSDVFGEDYFFSYGYRCNGYRDGYYYGSDGRPFEYYGRPFYRRNADCESFFGRHGYWYGHSDCSRFEVEKGHCEDYDRHGHQRF